MLSIKFLLIFSQCIIFVRLGFIQDKMRAKQLKVDRLDGVCNGKHFPFQGLLHGVKSDGVTISVANITMVVKEDLMDKIKGVITITRCHYKENLNSCEEFSKISNFNICQAMNPDGILGQNILSIAFTPKFKCPYKKGKYYADNVATNLKPFLFFNPDGWYWKTTVELFAPTTDRLLGRMCFDFSVVNV